ncbi:MAG: hypothetical protein LBM96_05955 [Methanobrevibacter sp.]|jgi:hypothetical protein|nr:hypothetical protein [Candidatus Methanoflexus mossambicus]
MGEKILILAPSGFGKTTSICAIPELNHKGLNPKETFLISTTAKGMPVPNSGYNLIKEGEKIDIENFSTGNRYATNNYQFIVPLIQKLNQSPKIKNIVIDDFNYLLQDYFVDTISQKGFDKFNTIGSFTGQILNILDESVKNDKNVFVLAHSENIIMPDDRIYVKMKTVGKLVDDKITPEGKFQYVLIGVSFYDKEKQKVQKMFLTNENENYASGKTPYGVFKEELIPNDLGLILDTIQNYKNNNKK